MKQVFCLLIALELLINVHAQTQNKIVSINNYLQLVQSAYTAMGSGNRDAASRQWDSIIKLNPVKGEYWYQLGISYYDENNSDKAITAFKNALRIGEPAPFECAYSIAKSYAKAYNKDSALKWLQQSFDLGYRNIMAAQHDTSFNEYFNDLTFKQIAGIPLQPFKNREEGWRFDLNLMVREVKRRSPNPYRHVTEKQFDSAVNALDKKISSLSDIQLVVEFEKNLVLVGDGHTMIYAMFERPEFQKNLPFDFHLFDEGLFITEADKRYEDLLGTQVIAFDGKSTADILKAIDPIINRDNELGPKILGLMRMRTIPLLFALDLIKSPDEVTLTIKDEQGNIKNILVKADCPVATRKLWDGLPDNWITYYQYQRKKPPLYQQNRFTHYWFKYFETDKAVYFQYNQMADDAEHRFNKFCDSLFAFIEANEVEKLIIDVRWNNGGNTLLAPYLIDKIVACKKINRQNKLFAIIGTRCYSATINLLGYLERFTPIMFVGEPTGSSPNFVGEDNPFELPYSKLMANVSDMYWQTSWPGDHRQWYAPQVYVSSSFKDFSAGKDSALDLILNFRNEQ